MPAGHTENWTRLGVCGYRPFLSSLFLSVRTLLPLTSQSSCVGVHWMPLRARGDRPSSVREDEDNQAEEGGGGRTT